MIFGRYKVPLSLGSSYIMKSILSHAGQELQAIHLALAFLGRHQLHPQLEYNQAQNLSSLYQYLCFQGYICFNKIDYL